MLGGCSWYLVGFGILEIYLQGDKIGQVGERGEEGCLLTRQRALGLKSSHRVFATALSRAPVITPFH